MTVRRATEGEAPALAALHGQAFSHSWAEDHWRLALSDPTSLILCVGSGRLLGMIAVRAVADEAEILTLAVKPEARRQGLAADLLGAASDHLSAAGVAALYLEVAATNAPALGLYQRFGFEMVALRQGYYRDGDDAQVLRCALPLADRAGAP